MQVVNYKSFDLSTSNYEDTCDMLDLIEEEICPGATAPIFMLVNCAGMAICGKFNENSTRIKRFMHSMHSSIQST